MVLFFEVAGFVALAVATFMVTVPGGLAVTGAELLALGFLLDYTDTKLRVPWFRRPAPDGPAA